MGTTVDEDRPVEDPVLLRSDELLTLEEQNVDIERVRDEESRDRAGVVDLGDGKTGGNRLVEAGRAEQAQLFGRVPSTAKA